MATTFLSLTALTQRGAKRLLVITALLTAVAAASGQGMLVRPMSVETTARPGQTLDLDFEIQNTLPTQALTVQADLEFLTQAEAGWISAPAKDIPEAEKKKFASALPWIKLDQASLDLPALQTKTFKMKVQVPSTARGFYSAAVTFKNKPVNGGGIGVVLRFLVPILIQVEGTVPRRKSSIGEPQVLSILPSESGPGGTVVSLRAANEGEGLTRIAGTLDLFGKVGDQWLKVSSAEIPVRRIIPGGWVRLSANLPKRLPKGTYKVAATLTSDGQRMPAFAQELQVNGDPGVGTLQPDIPLVVNPVILEVDAQAGAMRTGSISLRNPSNDPVEVTLSSILPEKLANVALGSVKGDEFGGQSWTQVAPDTVTIGPRQERKLRVTLSLPEGASKPYYYTTVLAQAKVNGVSVGATPILVTIKNTKVVGQPALSIGGPVALSQGENGVVTVSSAFTNSGDSHLAPSVTYLIRKDLLSDPLMTVTSQPDAPISLPVSTIRFNGVFDLKKLKPGDYVLVAVADYAGKTISSSTAFRVKATKTGPVIEAIKAPVAKKPAGKGSPK